MPLNPYSSPSGIIFKNIILPRLASLQPQHSLQTSVFCTSTNHLRPAADTARSSSSSHTLPFYSPSLYRHPRIPPDKTNPSQLPESPRIRPDFWDTLTESSKTAYLAAETIIHSHQRIPHTSISGKLQNENTPLEASDSNPHSSNHPPLASSSTSSASDLSPPKDVTGDPNITNQTSSLVPEALRITEQPPKALQFPPSIHALLRGRLFRLATFQILRTAEYATDERLVEDAAGYMDRRGAGKLAARLRKSIRSLDLHRSSASNITSEAVIPEIEIRRKVPKRIRLWSDPSSKDHRKPPDHWRNLTTISLSSPYGPNAEPIPVLSSIKADGDKTTRQIALTGYYNVHLARILSAPSSSTSPSPFLGSTSRGKGKHSPHRNLKQLDDLIRRIQTLEKHRGFVPDRVTANILVKCWLRCGIGSESTRHSHGSRNAKRISRGGEEWGQEEIVALWRLIKRLLVLPGPNTTPFSVPHPSRHAPVSAPSPLQPANTPPSHGSITVQDSELSYTHHIRPFCNMITRAAKTVGAFELVEEVLQWQKEQRALLHHPYD